MRRRSSGRHTPAAISLDTEAIAEYQQRARDFEGLHEPARNIPIRANLAYLESQVGRYQEALKRHLEILAEGDNIKDPGAYRSIS